MPAFYSSYIILKNNIGARSGFEPGSAEGGYEDFLKK